MAKDKKRLEELDPSDTTFRSWAQKDNRPSKLIKRQIEPGLFVYWQVSGRVTFVSRFHIKNGASGKITLGDFSTTQEKLPGGKVKTSTTYGIAETKRENAKIQEWARNGQDPRVMRKAEQIEQEQQAREKIEEPTLAELLELWINGYGAEAWADRGVTAKKTRQRFHNHVLPELGHYKITQLSRAVVKNVLSHVAAYTQRQVAWNQLKQMLDWACTEELGENRSLAGFSAAQMFPKLSKRKVEPKGRLLTPTELRNVMRTVDLEAELPEGWNTTRSRTRLVKLCLYCCCRPVELLRIQQGELLWSDEIWHLPEHKTSDKKGDIFRPILPEHEQEFRFLWKVAPQHGDEHWLVASKKNKAKPPISSTLRTVSESAPDSLWENGFWPIYSLRTCAKTYLKLLPMTPPSGASKEVLISLMMGHAPDPRHSPGNYDQSRMLKDMEYGYRCWIDWLIWLRDEAKDQDLSELRREVRTDLIMSKSGKIKKKAA